MPLLTGGIRPLHAGPNASGMGLPQAFPLTPSTEMGPGASTNPVKMFRKAGSRLKRVGTGETTGEI